MKKISLFIILIFTLSFLIGCAPRFPQIDSYYVSPFTLTDAEKLWNADTALSPDGESVITDGKYLASLKTGERENLYERFKVGRDTTLKTHDILNGVAYWSFDGRYLGMLADHYEPTSISAVSEVTYIFDLWDNSYRRFDIWSRSFSPFRSDQILTEDGVYSLKDGTITSFSPKYDFRQEKEFGVTNKYLNYLWSKNLGVPVAQSFTFPYNATSKDDVEVVVESFTQKPPYLPTYTVSTGFVSKFPNQLVGIFFDPTGEYILVAEWQCHESQIICGIYPFNADGVYDTVLTLVRWRTKEQKELIRLSEIDPKHVVAYGYMEWSADGSTVFISRKDALPVVLKVKYP